jgi:hypothetical protein
MEFHQNKCNLGDVPDTTRQCAKPLTNGPRLRQECHPGCNKISNRTSKLIFKGMETILLTNYKRKALVGGKPVVIPFPFFLFTSHLSSHHFDVE